MGQHACVSKGCQHGNSFYMEAKDEQWHMDKFGHLPKACPGCRSWRKQQQDYTYRCKACYAKRVVPKAKIIGYHKFVGVWEKPTLCRMCDADPVRKMQKQLWHQAHQLVNRFYYAYGSHPQEHLLVNPKSRLFGRRDKRQLADARKYIEAWVRIGRAAQTAQALGTETIVRNSLRDMGEVWGTSPVNVTLDQSLYNRLPGDEEGGQTRYQHIMVHFETKLGRNGRENRGFKESLGAKNETDGLRKLHDISMNTNPHQVVEFRDANSGYLVKYDLQRETAVVIHDMYIMKYKGRHAQPPPPPAYIVTAFVPRADQVAKKLAGTSTGSQWLPNLKK